MKKLSLCIKNYALCIIMSLYMVSCGGDNGGDDNNGGSGGYGAHALAFDEDGTRAGWGNGRYIGRTIRPVSN